jgi:hypothetical protein
MFLSNAEHTSTTREYTPSTSLEDVDEAVITPLPISLIGRGMISLLIIANPLLASHVNATVSRAYVRNQ